MLAKLSGKEDIVVGIGVAGRKHHELQKIIGMFVNTLALRNYPVGEKTFTRFLEEIKEKTLIAFENQDYPLEELTEKVVKNRDWSRNPLFDTAFVMQNLEVASQDIPQEALPGLQVKPVGHKNKVSRFDMTFICTDTGKKLIFTVEYLSKLFKKETIEIYCDCFKEIASSVIENRKSKLEDITLSSDIGIIKSTVLQSEVGDFGF